MDEKRQNREIKFRAWDGDESISHRDGPYIAVKAAWHPNANSRGYVKRHRLVIERKLGFYIPKRAIVHHKDEDKSNDHPDNLELLPTQKVHSKSHDSGKRNKNGHFVASEPIFKEIKFRLFNKNTKQYEVYDLSRLIRTTFRNSQFSFAGRFTGLKDKHGKEIYEGDRIQWRQPYRTTQTHTGDNIPNGSYTEPMEPGIRKFDGIVCFHNGAFCVDNYDGPEPCELSWINIQYDLSEIQSMINSSDDIFSDPEEGDLIYLIEEVAKLKTAEQLIEYLSGVEIIGNIYENPELSES